ncbi:MAG: sigma-70 family RNA polymerase sigma factor [Planctomycetota bacterium]|nr:sigma-70 family RNA polymerase sigma factor [Planctomycetota bacterium]
MQSAVRSTHITESLVARAKAGEREAYNRLFALAADRALLFIRCRLGPRLRERLQSMDVLQEAYVEAHRAFERFEYRGDDAFAAWLCRLIENKIRGLADFHGAQKRTPKGQQLPVSIVLERERADRTGPVTAVDRSAARERMANALDTLEPDQREVVLLRYFQDRTLQQIADVMGKSEAGVRRLLGKATRTLGRALKSGGSAA